MCKSVRLQLVSVDMVGFSTEHLYLYICLSCVVILSALIGIQNAHLGDQHLKLLPWVCVCMVVPLNLRERYKKVENPDQL